MRLATEISCDGPYVRVVLPDVLPPDWEAIRRDLESEIQEGPSRVMLIAAPTAGSVHDEPGLVDLVGWLQASGLNVVVLRDGD